MPHEKDSDIGKKNLFAQKDVMPSKFVDREDAITQVIGQFKDIIEKEADLNLELKKKFFYVCSFILVMLALMLMSLADTIVKYHLPDNSAAYAVELVSIISAFISAFMVLPRIIAKDLFSAKIQESLVSIVNKSIKKQHNKKKE